MPEKLAYDGAAMRNRPTYALQSADAALRLAQMLQTNGPMRVSDAATELQVAVSTAHRLLATLVYRGFAEQLPDRRYGPGTALRPIPLLDPSVSELRERSRAPMVELVAVAGESANLVVLAGAEVRFVATVECERVLRVGDRAGQRLPAHLTSGGKAILAALPDAELERFGDIEPAALARFRREVLAARHVGFASNHQETEKGLSAIGVALAPLQDSLLAAVCLAMPSVRYRRSMLHTYVASLSEAARAIEAAMGATSTTASTSERQV